jgi:hypothetical protein
VLGCGQQARVLFAFLDCGIVIGTTSVIETGLNDGYPSAWETLSDLVSRSICVFSGQASAIYYYLPNQSYWARTCCAYYGCHDLVRFCVGRMSVLFFCNDVETCF